MTAASAVGSSFDLLPLILINLPVKSLVRFQSVSKQWKFIICDDLDFTTKHSRKSSTFSYGLFINPFYFRDQTPEFVPVPGNPSGYVPSLCFLNRIPENLLLEKLRSCEVQMHAETLLDKGIRQRMLSCNGLLLCVFSLPFRDDSQKPFLVVCNPTTKRFKVLPQIGNLEGFTLVFSPPESPHYRVVALKRDWKRSETEIHMYSSETDRWELLRLIPAHWGLAPPRHRSGVSNGVFSNGIVYWLGMRTVNGLLHYYNLNSDDFGTLGLPFWRSWIDANDLMVSFGRVFFVVDFHEVNIYELDSSNMQWSLLTQQQRLRMFVEGICIPDECYDCEYVPSLAPI